MKVLIRLFLVLFAVMYVFLLVERYKYMNAIESRKPFQVRYEKSYVSKAIPYSRIAMIHDRLPKTTEFVVGLDPRASHLAWIRWMLVVTVGWIHFCFLFPLPERVASSYPVGFSLFLLPAQIALWLSPFFLVSNIWKFFSPRYAGYLHSSLIWILAGLAIVVVAAGLFSILTHIVLLVQNLIRKGKMPAGAGSRNEPARIPGPAVRRMEIDGVVYDV